MLGGQPGRACNHLRAGSREAAHIERVTARVELWRALIADQRRVDNGFADRRVDFDHVPVRSAFQDRHAVTLDVLIVPPARGSRNSGGHPRSECRFQVVGKGRARYLSGVLAMDLLDKLRQVWVERRVVGRLAR